MKEFDSYPLKEIGITRVGRLTELDIIGIPVWFASRPNSRCLSVTQGKGLTDRHARISAMMEAAEYAYAENADPLISCIGSMDEMEKQQRKTINLAALSMVQFSKFDRHQSRSWVEGVSLISGMKILTPYETVGMDMRVPSLWDNQAFRMSSVGLAAGFDLDHAIAHALFEVIENDATSLIDAIGLIPSKMKVIDEREFKAQNLRAVISQVKNAGLKTTFHRLKSGTGYAVMGAIIEDAIVSNPRRRHGGYAARVDQEDAALAALLEAAQSRLTDISGAREDIAIAEFLEIVKSNPDLKASQTLGVAEDEIADRAKPNIEEMLANCMRAGAEDVILFKLGGADIGIEVVKILVPGLDQSFADGQTHFGANTLRAFLELAEGGKP
jgi:ribosomal protein S12 methylthiotransferase accessory factor